MDFRKINQRIRHFRELRNYTQEYVASELGISQNSYSRLEREPAKLSLLRLDKLLNILEISWVDLLNDKINPDLMP